jgi:hypothetical protein
MLQEDLIKLTNKTTLPIPAIGTCCICNAENINLIRTNFKYENIKCECHSPYHFILFDHCINCEPEEPKVSME